MARKVITLCALFGVLLGVLCTPLHAATHSVYSEGNISTTYVQYFKDILSDCKITDNYVAFREGQYSYTMVVGDLEYSSGTITLQDSGKIYTFTQSGNYNSSYRYKSEPITNFSVTPGENIIYSDVGDYPELIERSARIETLILIAISIYAVYHIATRIFSHS